MSNVNFPIQTIKDGEKTTKICVEDVYKMSNVILRSLDRIYNDSVDIVDSLHKELEDYDGDFVEGEFIIGTGVSQPCNGDVYNEEIGNEVAFRKAKLNANLKKLNVLKKVYRTVAKNLYEMDDLTVRLVNLIDMDLEAIRKYNPDYLVNKDVY